MCVSVKGWELIRTLGQSQRKKKNRPKVRCERKNRLENLAEGIDDVDGRVETKAKIPEIHLRRRPRVESLTLRRPKNRDQRVRSSFRLVESPLLADQERNGVVRCCLPPAVSQTTVPVVDPLEARRKRTKWKMWSKNLSLEPHKRPGRPECRNPNGSRED